MRRGWSVGFLALVWATVVVLFASPELAFAQDAVGAAGIAAPKHSPLGMVVVLGGLALLPFLLIMVTSFVKISVVLSLLRQAIGAQQAPPNQVITGMAIILSVYIMAPVGGAMIERAQPVITQVEQTKATPKISELRASATDVVKPLKDFLVKHADEKERVLLYDLALELRQDEASRKKVRPDDLLIASPAFVLTELKEAFTIGFLLFIPFIIIDLVVANILLSLGMHMLSPTTVSLPFKLLLFVVVDGWHLVIKGLILGYV